MSFRDTYRPYLPAILTFIGGAFLAFGLFMTQPQSEGPKYLSVAGSIIALLGTFWSAHRQVKLSADLRMRNQKIIELSEELRGNMTGGNSFCYAYPLFNMSGADNFEWTFIHQGQFPLTDVSVRIHNLVRVNSYMDVGRTVKLGTIFPGRSHTFGILEKRLSSHGYNLFFLARNGSWTQEIRWAELPGVLAIANRVIRDGTDINHPLLMDVSPKFPGRAPPNEAWGELPPYS